VDRMIPAWGLYRLFHAIEQKGESGRLSLDYPDGGVTFLHKRGVAVDVGTDIDGLSFAEFLVQSGMVQERHVADSIATLPLLVAANVVRDEDAPRLLNSYVRNVVDILLPVPVRAWRFEKTPDVGPASPTEAVDMCAELFTAVQRNMDLAGMRVIVGRLGPFAKVTDSVSPGCLTHARAHFRGVPLVAELVSGNCPPLSPALLSDEVNLRILFGFMVAGGLVSTTSGAGTLSPQPVSTVSGPVDEIDLDEFNVGPASVHVAAVSAPETHNEVVDLDLDIDSDVNFVARNDRRDDYLVMDDKGSIHGFTSAGKVKPANASEQILVDPELDRAIVSELERASRLNHYDLLEIGPDARLSAVRMSQLRARRRYSPSRYEGGVSQESMVALRELIDRINRVGEMFGDLSLRVAYNRSQSISTPGLEAQLAAIFEARGLWRQGVSLLELRKPSEAIEYFEAAENIDQEEPEYLCSQGMALLAMAPEDDTYETIESLLDVAFSFDPDLIPAHLLAAEYSVRKSDLETAQSHIRKVLALDPDNRDAKTFKKRAKSATGLGQVSFKRKQESLLQKAIKLIRR